MAVIIVSGTPCTGKTTLAKKLSEKLKYKYVDVKRIIRTNNLDKKIDKKRSCMIVDEKRLSTILIKLIKESEKNLVIDSHLSHFIPKKNIDLCIITKCNLKTLEQRLKKRRYKKDKIRENLDSEIFDVCLNEAKEQNHNLLIIDTTKHINISAVIPKIQKLI